MGGELTTQTLFNGDSSGISDFSASSLITIEDLSFSGVSIYNEVIGYRSSKFMKGFDLNSQNIIQ